jgi:transcriptional regulator with XRE-family HTH domain
VGNEATQRSGAEISRLRIGRGWSRRQLAEAAGVSNTSVRRAEAGYGLTRPIVDALAKVLGAVVYDTVPILSGIRPVLAGRDEERPVLRARLERGWSRAEASRQLGVHSDTLMRLEAGHPVHPGNAKKVAEGYGLDVFELVPDPTTAKGNGTPVAA